MTLPAPNASAMPTSEATVKNVLSTDETDGGSAKTMTKKRKVHWATIDDKELFRGFTVKQIQSAKAKRTHRKEQCKRTQTKEQRERKPNAYVVQRYPFDESETLYQVNPAAEWKKLTRYRKFTIKKTEFEVDTYIFVSKTAEQQDTEDAIQHWIGQVLEVRAKDPSHVYLRVQWLYRPEDLPGGRKTNHGRSELIVSNHMDIIEAFTVEDRAKVTHWNEDPDSDWPLKDQLFWRQFYDIGEPKAKQCSSLRKFCVDENSCNPDEPLINCPACSKWLHARCLENEAVHNAYDNHAPPTKGDSKSSRRLSSVDAFSATLTTRGTEGSEQVCLKVTYKQPSKKEESWNVDVKCLFCHELIEKAATDVPSESPITSNTTAKDTGIIASP